MVEVEQHYSPTINPSYGTSGPVSSTDIFLVVEEETGYPGGNGLAGGKWWWWVEVVPTGRNAGTANTGKGGGGSNQWEVVEAGGSGIVIIRYKFQ